MTAWFISFGGALIGLVISAVIAKREYNLRRTKNNDYK